MTYNVVLTQTSETQAAVTIEANGTAGDSVSVPDLPINFDYTEMMNAITYPVPDPYYVIYTITGMVLVEADLGGVTMEFYVPLDASGENALFF